MGQKLSELKEFFGVMENGNSAPAGYPNSQDCERDSCHANIVHSANPDMGGASSRSNTVTHSCSNSASNVNASGKVDEHFENIYSHGAEGMRCKEENCNIPTEANSNPPVYALSHKSECTCIDDSSSTECWKTSECSINCTTSKRSSSRSQSSVNSKRARGKSTRSTKDISGSKKKRNHWVLKFNCARLKGGGNCTGSNTEPDIPEPNIGSATCVCTGYRRTEEHHLGAGVVFETTPPLPPPPPPSPPLLTPQLPLITAGEIESGEQESSSCSNDTTCTSNTDPAAVDFLIDMSKFNPDDYPIEDCDERARLERAREIAEGVDPPPGFCPGKHIQLFCPSDITIDNLTALFQTHLGIPSAALSALSQIDISLSPAIQRAVHTQVDYIHCLVPDLLQITSCSFYWGKMDRYEAERLLEGRPEGTFLLRDSAQEEYLFSVSFRKYGRSLHARIEQWNHQFSFDSHDPGVFASSTVCGLIEHYKDPTCCMFFEPMLTIPLHRNFPFPLQHLCRAVVCSKATYDGLNKLQLPKALKCYLKEYHYKQRVRVRRFDIEH